MPGGQSAAASQGRPLFLRQFFGGFLYKPRLRDRQWARSYRPPRR